MAIQSNTPDFLFENSYRSFPFEDSTELQKNFAYSSFLDAKGFSRASLTNKIKLIGASRWDTGSDKPLSSCSYANDHMQIGKVQLFFLVSAYPEDFYTHIDISIDNNTWPLAVAGGVYDTSGVKYLDISFIVDRSILEDVSVTGYTNLENITMEPSCVMECYQKSLDRLRIIRSGEADQYITGRVIFKNGINSSVSQSGNSIRINARIGEGLGRGQNTGTDISEKCNGILAVNGIQPNNDGKFTIEAGSGISVVDDPVNHRIIISIQEGSGLLECEAP